MDQIAQFVASDFDGVHRYTLYCDRLVVRDGALARERHIMLKSLSGTCRTTRTINPTCLAGLALAALGASTLFALVLWWHLSIFELVPLLCILMIAAGLAMGYLGRGMSVLVSLDGVPPLILSASDAHARQLREFVEKTRSQVRKVHSSER